MRLTPVLLFIAASWLTAAAPSQALPLWKIEGTSNQIHLLGSIHFLRAQDYPLPAAIMDALDDADVVVMELDLGALDPIAAQTVIMGMAVDPQGRNLETMLGARSYRKALALAGEFDVDLEALQPFEPWFAAIQITQIRMMQLGFDGSYGVDARLASRAMSQGKPIRGLETLETQLHAMDSLPIKAQQDFLIQTLEDAAEIDNKLDDIVDAWRTGNTQVLERDLADGVKEQPRLYQQLLVDRNRNWTGTILSFIDKPENYLIVVGAMHLVGDDSVQQMLDDAGYPTTQIKN